jgi:hypothetical protein
MRVAFERRPYEDVEIIAPVCIRLMKVHAMAAFGDKVLRARRPGRTGSNFSTGFHGPKPPTIRNVEGQKERRLGPIGSELPPLGPWWILFDRILATSRLSPPRLYRLLWGLEPRAAETQQTRTPDYGGPGWSRP